MRVWPRKREDEDYIEWAERVDRFNLRMTFVAWVLFIWCAAFLLLGCTAAGYDRQAALMAAAKGCYCAAEKCDRVVSAVGIAATVAAEHEAAKQVKVSPR